MSPDRPAAVVVLAAGEGTRMRSSIPKVLHAVGGRTLVHHAVAAAERPRARPPGGRGRARPRPGRGPSRRGRARRPPRRSRTSSSAPATRSAARWPTCRSSTGTVVVTYGDVPLLTAETLRDLLAEHAGRRQRRHRPDRGPRRPHGLRPGRARRPTARSSGIVEQKDATDAELRRSARSTPASTPSTPPPCATAWPAWTPTTRRASST